MEKTSLKIVVAFHPKHELIWSQILQPCFSFIF
jgi:hypothetical protein